MAREFKVGDKVTWTETSRAGFAGMRFVTRKGKIVLLGKGVATAKVKRKNGRCAWKLLDDLRHADETTALTEAFKETHGV